jgi:DNA-binding CsgD family transcriptional regulator
MIEPDATLLEKLTPREHAILEQLMEGRQSKHIATILDVSPRRVDKLIERVREKLDATTRFEAAERYRKLRAGGVILPDQSFPLPDKPAFPPPGHRVPADAVYSLADAATFASDLPWVNARPPSAPEFWALRLGALPRLVLVVAGAVGLLVLAVLGLSLSEGLSKLIGS